MARRACRARNDEKSRVICPTGKSLRLPPCSMSIPFFKNIPLNPSGKSVLRLAPSCPGRGALRTSPTWGGMRWTQAALKTRACACGRRSRVVLTPRRRRQACGGNCAGDGDKQARSPGSTKETVKTIARGMPGETGVTVVTCSCAFFICTRGCGRIQRPAFPAPSALRAKGS